MSETRIPNSPLTNNNISSDTTKYDQDKLLPIANVSRIMKKSLPTNAKISKEAKETVQECVSEFISFVTGEASDKCQKEKRKTINGDDLLWAMTTLGFENYVDLLKTYLGKYRETEGEKNNMARHEDDDHQESEKITANPNPNFLGRFKSGSFHDNGELFIGFSESLVRNRGGFDHTATNGVDW